MISDGRQSLDSHASLTWRLEVLFQNIFARLIASEGPVSASKYVEDWKGVVDADVGGSVCVNGVFCCVD